MTTDFAMARMALLSVEEAADLLARDDDGGELVRTVVDLAWASPSGDPGPRPHDTTMRYIARMGGRATPFGLLAGTGHTSVGPRRRMVVGPRDRHRVQVRVDFEVLERLIAEAIGAADPGRRPLRRNRTLRRHHGGLRYMKDGDASAAMVAVRPTAAIEAVLDIAGDKTVLAGDLVDALHSRFPGSARDALQEFVDRTVEGGLLTTAVDLVRPGEEPIDLAIAILDRIGDAERVEALAALGAAVRAEQRIEPGIGPRLDAAWERIRTVSPTLHDVLPNRRFHLDLEMNMAEAVLEERLIQDSVDAVCRMEELFGPRVFLREFRKAFRQRYEDAEVPLLEALDLECGVLPTGERNVSPLADQAEVTMSARRSGAAEVPAGVLRLYGEWAARGGEIDISALPAAPRTTARGLLASLLNDYEGRFDGMLTAGFQRTPLSLIARFVVGREEFSGVVRAWSDAGGVPVDDPDGPMRAELIYSPGGRISNAILRPRIFQHEVALQGGGDGSLSLDRLRLRLEGENLRLRDSVTGRDVILEMNSSHNVTAGGLDPIYTFLGMLVSPGAVGWRWGQLAGQPHLPRVVCGRLIVAPECWTLTSAAVRHVLGSGDPVGALRARLPGLGDRRFVGVGEDDRLLPIDVRSPRSIVLALKRMATKEDAVQFTELPHVESPGAVGPTGRHVCEVTVPLRSGQSRVPHRRPVSAYDPDAGLSWAYFKLYCGSSAADAVVRQIAEYGDRLRHQGLIDEWFFLRYFDEGFHVRVRLRPARPDRRPAVLVAMDQCAAELRRQGLVTRVATDDYVPEVGRYGGTGALRRAEALFSADSAAVARMIAVHPSEPARLFQCVADIAAWTDVLVPDREAQHAFLLRCRDGLGLRYSATKNVRGRFFRHHRAEMEAYLSTAVVDRPTLSRLADLAAGLRGDGGSVPLGVAASVLHMHANRLFMVDGRRLEFLAYDLAGRKVLERRARAPERAAAGAGETVA